MDEHATAGDQPLFEVVVSRARQADLVAADHDGKITWQRR
jgi:hypothetical protein